MANLNLSNRLLFFLFIFGFQAFVLLFTYSLCKTQYIRGWKGSSYSRKSLQRVLVISNFIIVLTCLTNYIVSPGDATEPRNNLMEISSTMFVISFSVSVYALHHLGLSMWHLTPAQIANKTNPRTD